MSAKRILFLLKQGQAYGAETYSYGNYVSSGLYWSTKFVVDMLVKAGVEAELREVFDADSIDGAIQDFNPDTVIIEALWVVPEKFDELMQIRPNVEFVVALHSDVPFLGQESIAVSWVKGYAERGVKIAVNSKNMFDDTQTILMASGIQGQVLYLPDFYPVQPLEFKSKHGKHGHINIACFGAIRSLKNQLIQAVAAINFAEKMGQVLHFHINSTHTEVGSDAVLKNIRDLFSGTKHVLVEESWLTHEEFLSILRKMDLGMHVSFTETFCIVAADMASVGVPMVVSPQVQWAAYISQVQPTSSEDIFDGLVAVYEFSSGTVAANHSKLKKHVAISRRLWLEFVECRVCMN